MNTSPPTYDPLALLDAFWNRPHRDEWDDAEAAGVFDDALRAVFDLHAPNDDVLPECTHCYASGDVVHVPWPCPTVKAITDILQARQPEPPKPPSPPNPCYWAGSTRVHVKPGCRCGSRLSQGLERLMP